MSSTGQHTRTEAVVVRAGVRTALVSLAAWYHGQILAAVDTWELVAATGHRLPQLPGTWLTVAARLDAIMDEGLELRDWEPLQGQASKPFPGPRPATGRAA
jgi:hypothetical protein